MTPVDRLSALATVHRAEIPARQRKALAQVFTPPALAHEAARPLRVTGRRMAVLDAGAGLGILGVAAATRLAQLGAEVDLTLLDDDPSALARAEAVLPTLGLDRRIHPRIRCADALALADSGAEDGKWDVVISNPPWRKTSPRSGPGGDAPNAYARFMDAASRWLRPGGQAAFIVPRSFTSGRYFRPFRRRWFAAMGLTDVAVIGNRAGSFTAEKVLQETLILHATRDRHDRPVQVRAGASASSLGATLQLPMSLLLWPDDPDAVLHLPEVVADVELLHRPRQLTLGAAGLSVRTGRVVPFRATQWLADAGVPLIWMHHIRDDTVTWPLDGFAKPQHIDPAAPTILQLANHRHVFVRRVSAREERRRLVGATWHGSTWNGPWIGVENHVNVIGWPDRPLSAPLASALVAWLAAPDTERLFRLRNGHTQVNAGDLRALPLSEAVIQLLPKA